jgi:hypothetical protein
MAALHIRNICVHLRFNIPAFLPAALYPVAIQPRAM